MSDCSACEGKVGICKDGDDPDAVDAIDMWNDLVELADVFSFGFDSPHHTRCRDRSQFSSMKAWYRTVNNGTCHALTGGGEG